MRQGISDYSGRVDRAWSPPTLSDVEAEAETARQRISPRP
jgi:hypothetical protein